MVRGTMSMPNADTIHSNYFFGQLHVDISLMIYFFFPKLLLLYLPKLSERILVLFSLSNERKTQKKKNWNEVECES